MLSENYFHVLEVSAPENMECFYAGVFKNDELVGGIAFQYLDFRYHSTFQKGQVWCSIRNFLAKKFSKDVMILGNNMLTGQNGFYFDMSRITSEEIITVLEQSVQKMQKDIRKTSLVIYKDYRAGFARYFQNQSHQSYFRFSVQPNMILSFRENWRTFDDYLNDFSTKYRTRAKTARKKFSGLEKYELDLEKIGELQAEMKVLYQNVADNAPFNTFFLTDHHFEDMKKCLGENFRVFGYFSDGKLIGFYTLLLNNNDIDTYFLGYDKLLQKEKQLYLNMLLDMVEFGVKNQYEKIIFGRTALEIKSTIGAVPVEIFGLIKHKNIMLNRFMNKIFPSLNPKSDWIQRKPFKD